MLREEILAELRRLLEAIDNPETDRDGLEAAQARIAELNDELERIDADAGEQRATREAAAEAARNAIDNLEARTIDNIPFGGNDPMPNTYDPKAARRAFFKNLATLGNIQLAEGNELTPEERTAYTHTTANTEYAVPKEYADEILMLVKSSAPLFGDIHMDHFKKIYEIATITAIAAGDAATTSEGAAPSNDQQLTDGYITLTGTEIKKTFKMSRKMAVQALDTFEAFVTNEIVARLTTAADTFVIGVLSSGIASASKKTPATLTKAGLVEAIGLCNNFGLATPKGIRIYANNKTIWNEIAMLEDGENRSYFVDEKTEDPTIQGRIFGKPVVVDDNLSDNVIYIGYPDLVRGNVFEGPDVTAYVEGGTQLRCFDGYLLFDAAMAASTVFSRITITPA